MFNKESKVNQHCCIRIYFGQIIHLSRTYQPHLVIFVTQQAFVIENSKYTHVLFVLYAISSNIRLSHLFMYVFKTQQEKSLKSSTSVWNTNLIHINLKNMESKKKNDGCRVVGNQSTESGVLLETQGTSANRPEEYLDLTIFSLIRISVYKPQSYQKINNNISFLSKNLSEIILVKI